MTKDQQQFLPYGRQHLEEDDIDAVVACLRSDWLTQGPAVDAFEAALAERLSVPHVIACSNGTAALHLAAVAAGLGPECVAIVPSITFLATANAVRYTGAEVVFCDVDPSNGLMRPEDLAAALDRARRDFPGQKVLAAFPVHLNGQTADMDGLGAVADAAGIVLIEDACHALGAERKPRGSNVPAWDPVGSCRESWAACFSFHPVKSIATGEGGAVVLRDDEAAARIRRLRSHGVERADGTTESVLPQGLGRNGDYPGAYGMREIGFNYRITDIQCALGLSQLGKLDRFLEKRRALAARYDDIVPGLGARAVPIAWRSDCRPAYHLYPVLVETAATQNRAAIMGALRAAGVGTQVHYIPVHRQPYYVGRYGLTDLPGADAYFDRILSLPIFFDMTPDDVDRVVGALDLVLGGADA